MERTSTPRCNVEGPRYVEYATLSERMKTYKNWPNQHITDPSALAATGLYYTGEGDLVRCFCCGGGLMNWEKGDIPWIEHAKSFPLCSFLNLKNTWDVNSERGKNEKAEICKQIRNFAFISNQQGRRSVEEARRRATYVAPDSGDPGQPDLPQPNLIDKHSTNILSKETAELVKKLEEQRSLEQLREENKRLKDRQTCKTCRICETCILFLPCSDLVACEFCGEMLQNCSYCGKNILEKIKIYR